MAKSEIEIPTTGDRILSSCITLIAGIGLGFGLCLLMLERGYPKGYGIIVLLAFQLVVLLLQGILETKRRLHAYRRHLRTMDESLRSELVTVKPRGSDES